MDKKVVLSTAKVLKIGYIEQKAVIITGTHKNHRLKEFVPTGETQS